MNQPVEPSPNSENIAPSQLAVALQQGQFVVTAELVPPKTPDFSLIEKNLEYFKKGITAVNITDNASAVIRMSPLAVTKVVIDHGLEPVLQLTCRDRNRLALQSDLLGAYAFGVRNVLCLSGDYILKGDDPAAKPVCDMDSVTFLLMVRQIKERGKFSSGLEIRDKKNVNL